MKEPKLKLCHLSTHGWFDPVPQLGKTDTGGQVVYVLETAKALASAGIDIDIYTRWFDKSRARIEHLPDYPSVRVIRIPAGKWEFVRKEDIYPLLPELTRNMIEFIKQQNLNYELFHGHYVDGGIVAFEVARKLKKPCFFTPHSLGAWKKETMGGEPAEMDKVYNFTHRINEEERLLKSATAVTLTTHLQVEKIRQLYSNFPSNYRVIPPGVDTERFRPIKEDGSERKKLVTPERYIFCLSRIDANKGHDYLLNAFSLIVKKTKDIHLVIGGGSPRPVGVEIEVTKMIKELIKQHKMERNVHLTGYIPDELLPLYYRCADVFVLPSRFEPFGMTVLEAMSCGATVVASSLGGIKEIIEDGVNGILVDPSNTTELSEAIANLLQDRQKAKTIGQKARKFAVEEYSWTAIGKKFIKFYSEFIDTFNKYNLVS